VKLLAVLLYMFAVSVALGQGSLSPSGPPSASMKSLDQIEPRTVISKAGTVITEPGAYVLDRDLITSGFNPAIKIETSVVSVDLNGFRIDGSTGTGNGVFLTSDAHSVTLRNGTIHNCLYHGIYAGTSEDCIFESLKIIGNGRISAVYDGLNAGKGTVVRHCMSIGNGGDGFVFPAGCRVEYCTVRTNGAHGVNIAGTGTQIGHCTITDNVGAGLHLGAGAQGTQITDSTVSGNGNAGVHLDPAAGTCNDNRFVRCSVTGNGDEGVFLEVSTGECSGNVFGDCTIAENEGMGVRFESSTSTGRFLGNEILSCSVRTNQGYAVRFYRGVCKGNVIRRCNLQRNTSTAVYLYGIDEITGTLIAECVIQGNGGAGCYVYGSNGICDGNTIRDCTIDSNRSKGVYLHGYNGQCEGNAVIDNIIRNNVFHGIFNSSCTATRIEGNHVSGTTYSTSSYGIKSTGGSGNFIFRNTCHGQDLEFAFSTSDVYGPVVYASGQLATTGNESHPLANIAF
jgi:hypothetical protein